MIHTVKGSSIVSKAEVDVFLEFLCFFYDPMNVGNLISGSSAFSKSSLNIWSSQFMRVTQSLTWELIRREIVLGGLTSQVSLKSPSWRQRYGDVKCEEESCSVMRGPGMRPQGEHQSGASCWWKSCPDNNQQYHGGSAHSHRDGFCQHAEWTWNRIFAGRASREGWSWPKIWSLPCEFLSRDPVERCWIEIQRLWENSVILSH